MLLPSPARSAILADMGDAQHVGGAGGAKRHAGGDDDALAGLGEAFSVGDAAGSGHPCVLENGRLPERPMNREQILQALAHCKPTLASRFGVKGIALFGSTARDTARADSDIDVLISFNGPATSERYFGVQFFLEDLLGRPVDLVTEKALRPELRPFIEREAIHV